MKHMYNVCFTLFCGFYENIIHPDVSMLHLSMLPSGLAHLPPQQPVAIYDSYFPSYATVA